MKGATSPLAHFFVVRSPTPASRSREHPAESARRWPRRRRHPITEDGPSRVEPNAHRMRVVPSIGRASAPGPITSGGWDSRKPYACDRGTRPARARCKKKEEEGRLDTKVRTPRQATRRGANPTGRFDQVARGSAAPGPRPPPKRQFRHRAARLAERGADLAARVAHSARGSAGPGPPAPWFPGIARAVPPRAPGGGANQDGRVARLARGTAGPARRVAQFAKWSAAPGSPPPSIRGLRDLGPPGWDRRHQSGPRGRPVRAWQGRPGAGGHPTYEACARQSPHAARGHGPAGSTHLREVAPIRTNGPRTPRVSGRKRGCRFGATDPMGCHVPTRVSSGPR